MEKQTITMPAKIDAATFRRFALFDTFHRQKRWRAPVLFAAVMAAFAAVCFACQGSRSGAALLGAVLLTVGLGLPAVYVLSYLLSVRKQGRRLGLDGSRPAYTLRLGEDGIQVVSGKERAEYRWEQMFYVYRVPACIYLYVTPRRAFLLPEDGQGGVAWALLMKKLPAEKLEDRR